MERDKSDPMNLEKPIEISMKHVLKANIHKSSLYSLEFCFRKQKGVRLDNGNYMLIHELLIHKNPFASKTSRILSMQDSKWIGPKEEFRVMH